MEKKYLAILMVVIVIIIICIYTFIYIKANSISPLIISKIYRGRNYTSPTTRQVSESTRIHIHIWNLLMSLFNQSQIEFISTLSNDEQKNGLIIPSKRGSDLPETKNLEFTYSFWLRVENVPNNYYSNTDNNNDGQQIPNYILNRDYSPCIQYLFETNTLRVSMKIDNDKIASYDIKDALKIQNWNHICVILDNRNLDIFINGKFLRSFMLPNVPIIDSSTRRNIKLFENGGTFAEITNIRYFNHKISNYRVKRLYGSNKYTPTPLPNTFWWTT
tara:strand:- start:4554 stop:5375 length:822 start_codon:yes stop_codon:yes gene_type:complete